VNARKAGLGGDSPGKKHLARSGLRRALLLALSLSLVFPGGLAGFVLIYQNYHRTLDVDTQIRAERFADLLQAGFRLPLWQITPDSGRPLLDAIATDPSVASIVVSDPSGNTLVEFRRTVDQPGKAIVIDRPIAMNQEVLGQVSLAYATSAARDEVWRSSFLLIAVIAAQLVVSLGLLGAWLARRVIVPLDKLRASAEHISAGDLKSEVPTLGDDEFGVLADELDSMRDSLAQSVTQLEERVAARTTEIADSNARLTQTLDDLRRMQNHLIQTEKLASLGSLVAAVAHELNTPIGTGITMVSTIGGYCGDFRKQVAAGVRRSQLETFLSDLESAGALAQSSLERAAQLVQDFKQVAVDQTSSRRRDFELAEVIREMMVAMRFRYKHSPVRFALEIPRGVAMDSFPGALEQVLINLIENAVVHAFDGRTDGVLQISAQTAVDGVTLSVADNGHGIPTEQLGHVFDPFFTTRLGRGGSGLGLSIVYNLVTSLLGGEIAVQSAAGEGCVFTLKLPLIAPNHAESIEAADSD